MKAHPSKWLGERKLFQWLQEANPKAWAEAMVLRWYEPVANDNEASEESLKAAPIEPSEITIVGKTITEDAAAIQIGSRHAGEWLYDHDVGGWYRNDGKLWTWDGTGRVRNDIREDVRDIVRDAKPDLKRYTERYSFRTGIEKTLRDDPAFAATSERWNHDPCVLGFPDGTVAELYDTFRVRAARPEDGITKTTLTAPAGDCPRFIAFLERSCGGDAGLFRLIQQWFGYSLTGLTTEQSLLFIFGPGDNGKSVLVDVMSRVLGGYATTVGMETLTVSKFDSHPTEIADLHGARFVTGSETEEGRALAENRVKLWTGGDLMRARKMRTDFFYFRPQFKLTLIGNHQPIIRNPDAAMRRRVIMVPFRNKLKEGEKDKGLLDKLMAEAPGILQWAIEGWKDWRANGLIRPQAAIDETDAYFESQDVFAHWLEERCETCLDTTLTPTRTLFTSWRGYADQTGEDAGSDKTFRAKMERHGFVYGKTKRDRGYRGVRLATGGG